MKVVRDRTHKLIGKLPDKCGPGVRYKTLGEQREMALGMSHLGRLHGRGSMRVGS